MADELYADVVLPLACPPFTYRVGEALAGVLAVGRCVEVPIGKRKITTGVVWRLHRDRPPYKTIRTIERTVPGSPTVDDRQRAFWEWTASYYMCTLGEVMKAALPSALKPEGFSAEEFAGAAYRRSTVRMAALHPSIDSEEVLSEVFGRLTRAKRQYDALIEFVEAAGADNPFGRKVPRNVISCSAAIIGALQQKNILVLSDEQAPAAQLPPFCQQLPQLTLAQRQAAEDIEEAFADRDTVLLRGVTGSGKTEIYIHLIARTLAEGRDALYLLPEIALTSQLIRRMERYFGRRVVTYHSRFTERQRTAAYLEAAEGCGGRLVVGTRSAIFMPLTRIGLVVVDEEHEQSFKQADPAPRYNARDCAVVLARLHGARTLLGSATPSLESYVNAMEGKYGSVTLDRRYGGAVLPGVIISDITIAARRGERRSHFNRLLVDKIDEALSGGRQVILFQNRRGFSPYVECPECGWVASCPHCNVTLTYHRADGSLRCHYCGHSVALPPLCPACSRAALETRGFGTEKVEDELQRIFPEARIARLDRDTAGSQRSFNEIISGMERGQTDILIGTQMITKGFDFGGVSLVGILNADNLLAYPDFRAAERAFQTITQVAGRAGRRATAGEVVIQTSQPDNITIRQAAAGDYEAMARTQLAERMEFGYPPYCRIVTLTLRHRDKALLVRAAMEIAGRGRAQFASRLLGPEPPPVDRVKNEYMLSFMLKIARGSSAAAAKQRFREIAHAVVAAPEFRGIALVWNVDPV